MRKHHCLCPLGAYSTGTQTLTKSCSEWVYVQTELSALKERLLHLLEHVRRERPGLRVGDYLKELTSKEQIGFVDRESISGRRNSILEGM